MVLAVPGPAAKLLQEVERELLAHVAVDLAAGDPPVETRCSRRVHALFDLFDDVHRGRPAEPGDQRLRQRVVVRDGPGRAGVGQVAARGVGQRDRERLDALVVLIVDDVDLDPAR